MSRYQIYSSMKYHKQDLVDLRPTPFVLFQVRSMLIKFGENSFGVKQSFIEQNNLVLIKMLEPK